MVEAVINLFAAALFALGLTFAVLAVFIFVVTTIAVVKKIREEVRKR